MAWPGRCDAGPSTGMTRVSPVERQRARAMDRNVPDPEFASRPAGDHNGSRGPLPQGGGYPSWSGRCRPSPSPCFRNGHMPSHPRTAGSGRRDRVVVVLPTYNERENIRSLLDAILDQTGRIGDAELSVLVVDDQSPDGTGGLVREYAGRNPHVCLLGSARKRGLGIAYKRAMAHALEEMGADVVFEMDADFSHDPNDIPRLLARARNGHDFVIGSRY